MSDLCEFIGLGWLPVVTVAFSLAGIIGSYASAVSNGFVAALFPYISDSGNFPPGSCILAQFFNLGAAFSVAVYYIRYKMLADHFDKIGANRILKWTNVVTLLLGFANALGTTLVGNFQYYAVPLVHVIGALLAFVVGILYCLIDAILTGFATRKPADGSPTPLYTGRCAVLFRLGLGILEIVTFLLYMIFQQAAVRLYDGNNLLQYNPSNAGYTEHVISTSTQWATVGLLLLYILTFTPEFSHVCWNATVFDRRLVSKPAKGSSSQGQGQVTGNVQPITFSAAHYSAAALPPQTTCFQHHAAAGHSAAVYPRPSGGYVSRYDVVGPQHPWPALDVRRGF